MHNPQFYERQRMRASTWDMPRFLHSFDETIDGGLILPRGMLDTVTALAEQAGSRLDITDERAAGHEPGIHLHRHPDAPASATPSPNWRSMTWVCWSRRRGRARP